MKKQQLIHQQGDVRLVPIAKLPAGVKLVNPSRHRILQHGEGGHRHAFLEPELVNFYTTDTGYKSKRDIDAISRITDLNGEKYIEILEPTLLSHGFGEDLVDDGQCHSPQLVNPGLYELDIVREENFFTKAIERVRD